MHMDRVEERAPSSVDLHAAASGALVAITDDDGGAQPTPTPSRALVAPLAQSIARAQISSTPTLLPPHLAQLVTALSLAARVSLRASSLFVEAVVETLRRGTATGLGVTRRALIAAVGSARTLHYVKEGLDWSGKDAEGKKVEDAFLQILDKYTNLGIYLIHHTFTLAELFSMSGFYLTLNTIQTGFHAAEESVRLFDTILGSTESSRALSSIITLVRTEFSRDDPRFRPTGLLSEQERGAEQQQQRRSGTLGSLAALTKAMTAFACLQMATHRRTLRELKQRVVYDCTVVIDSQADLSSDESPDADEKPEGTPSRDAPKTARSSPFLDPTPDFAGRYAGPSLPKRRRLPSGNLPESGSADVSAIGCGDARTTRFHRRTSSITSIAALTTDFDEQVLTDLRSDLDSRIGSSRTQVSVNSTAASSPAWSRRTSVAFDLAGLAFTALHSKDTQEIRQEDHAKIRAVDAGSSSGSSERTARGPTLLPGTPWTLPDDSRAEPIGLVDPDETCGAESTPTGPRVAASSDATRMQTEREQLPQEVQTLLALLEQRYTSTESEMNASSSLESEPLADSAVGRSGTHVVRTRSGRFSYEVRVEQDVSTTTTTVCSSDGPDKSRVVSRTTRFRNAAPLDNSLVETRSSRDDAYPEPDLHSSLGEVDTSMVDTDADWVEIPARKRWAAPSESCEHASDAPMQTTLTRVRRDEESMSGLRRGRQRLQTALSSVTKTLTHDKRYLRGPCSRLDGPTDMDATPNRAEKAGISVDPRRKLADPSSRANVRAGTGAADSFPARSVGGSVSPVIRTFVNPFKLRPRDRATGVSSLPGSPRSLSPQTTRVPTDRVDAATFNEEAGNPQLGEGRMQALQLRSEALRDSGASPRSTKSTLHDPPSAYPHHARSPRHSASQQTLRSRLTTTCHEASLPGGVHEPGSSNFPSRHLVENMQHFARYSSAAYGQSFLRIFGIARHEFKFPHTEIHANNHAFADHVGIHVEDILLSSFTDPSPTFASDEISQIVNYVSIDHSIKAVVLACRGSLGLADILTDLTCSYEPIPVPHADPAGLYYVHSGMFCASTSLQRGVVHDVIAEALAKYPDYGLVLCGHSLGGGVASLLSILWSQPTPAFRRELDTTRDTSVAATHPPLRTLFVTSRASGLPAGRPISCYTYGVPCVASPDLVAYCRGLVISTVHNYDIVPTLSLGVLRDLKSMATGFYAEQGICEAIVGRVIGTYRSTGAAAASTSGSEDRSTPDVGAPTDPPKEAQLVLLSSEEVTSGRGENKALAPAYQDPDLVGKDIIGTDVELSNWLWSLRTTLRAGSDSEKLYPPGNVYVVENYGVFVEEHDSSRAGRRREGRRVLLRAIDDVERRFSEPVFSRTMLSDHSPASYEVNCDLLAAAVI